MKLSVVVGTLNRLAQLRACVASIFEQTTIAVRVYVTDAGSTDGTIKYLESIASERLVPIFVGRRQGQAKSYNDVFRHIDTPYTCWLSDDNMVVNRGLDVAASILEENPRIGMVGLKIKDVIGPYVEAPYIGGVSIIGILNVNQGMLRTPILKQVGGFSEAFAAVQDYGIDPDLTAKVLFSGQAIAYTRKIVLHHFRNWSTDPSSGEYARRVEGHRAYLELYRHKYGSLARGAAWWKAKRLVWQQMQRSFGDPSWLNSTQSVLGLIARDWNNIFASRYISLLDPVRCRGKAHYLVQYCPRFQRPESLPADPLTIDSRASPDGSTISAPPATSGEI